MRNFARSMIVAGAALVLCTGVAFAGSNSSDVNAGAAKSGNFGYEVILDGVSTNQVWVQHSDNMSCEQTFNWELAIGDHDLVDGDDKLVSILVRQEDPANNIVRCTIRQALGNPNLNQLNCLMRRNDGRWRFAGNFTYTPGIGYPVARMEIVMSDGGDNGSIRFFKNGAMVHERFDYDNDAWCNDRYRIGLTQPPTATTNFAGGISFDDAVLTR